MRRFLPSKKLLVFLGVALVILACCFLFWQFKNRKVVYIPIAQTQKENSKIVEKISQEIAERDTDGDELKDWEETLWKTDPHNPDSDGDGTNDNTEILANRNPLVPGPNDLMKDEIADQNEENDLRYEPALTQTDILSRELFAGYVALKQNGQLGTEKESQFVEALAAKSLPANANLEKKYSLDDLIIIQDNNRTNLQIYASTLNNTIAQIPDSKCGALVLKESLEKNSSDILSGELDRNILIYEQAITWFLKIPAPSDLAKTHLGLINTLNEMVGNTKNMKNVFSDPLAGITGAQQYLENDEQLALAFIKISGHLGQEGVNF